MTDVIQLLPDHVANQIAAGEVVQRPASVVKELLENAIDAGAGQITLLIKEAGKTLIQVTDDGSGMSWNDAQRSFERHATSKIRTADELFRIQTKGFRGEALASIAAVAQVQMRTRREEDEIGTEVKIEGGKGLQATQTVCPKGTTIAVRNLFFNIPARRNFLKSKAVENRHIIDEFQRVAMAHPGVQFKFIQDGTDLFHLLPANRKQRIARIFGGKTDEKLVPVEEQTEILSVSGFVIKPEFARKSRGEQFFFVNDRFIKSSYLHHAVVSAFEGLLKDGHHPGYFLFLQIPTESIDINIHPTKTEIKFDDDHAIYAMLRATVKHGLGQFSVAPVLDFDQNSELQTPYGYQGKTPKAPSIEVDPSFNPFDQGSKKGGQARPAIHTERASNWESLYAGVREAGQMVGEGSSITIESEEVDGSLFEESEQQELSQSFQLQQKYIIASVKSGMMVIHQHRAHQRILYEDLLHQMTVQEGVSQQLLFPIDLPMKTQDLALIESIKEQLQFTGFVFEQTTENALRLSGVPVGVEEGHLQGLFDGLLADLQNEVPGSGFSQTDLLARSMAANLSIRSGQALKQEEQRHLIDRLFACKEPKLSPNNKPVLVVMSATDFDKKFN